MESLAGLLFLSSALFLGWNLGANGAGVIIGSAVGSRMLSLRRAALIGAVFVIIGATVAGTGGSETLGRLGRVGSAEAAFALALGSGITLFLFTRLGLPVSTSQAIVGAIVGWNWYSMAGVDWTVFGNIALTWISAPILAGVLAALNYHLMRLALRRIKVHLFHLDNILRFALALAGAYGAFSLGMNNIANVMGVFVPVLPIESMELGLLTISPATSLFFLGGLAIAAGILTYSRKVMETLGSEIVHLAPENALAVVVAISSVLLLFSSPWLPRVPVSSSQAAVGAVIGVGLMRGARNIRYRLVGKIAVGWILTPTGAAVVTFVLLNLLGNVFGMDFR
jgi:PiT family inorganic phosphate transporter